MFSFTLSRVYLVVLLKEIFCDKKYITTIKGIFIGIQNVFSIMNLTQKKQQMEFKHYS